jgi:hypothetical protein
VNETEKTEILSLSKSLGETAIDSLLGDGIFKDIPFIGTGISFVKLINSVSDRILLWKIFLFINNLNLKNQEEIDKFKEKYLKDSDYKKIGLKVLLILERAVDEPKIKWLSNSLRLFVDGDLDKKQFLRISSIINSGYTEYVQQIKIFDQRHEITSQNDLIETYILDHLFSIGLLESHGFDGGDFAGLNSGTIYSLNNFGIIMKEKII